MPFSVDASNRFLLAACALMLSGAFVGCDAPKLGAVPVSGSVTYEGVPARYGIVSFRPVGTLGRAAEASIRDGHYEALALNSQKGLAPGEYRVSVVYSDRPLIDAPGGTLPEDVAVRYRQHDTSGLTLTVPEGSEPIIYNIELKN